MDAGFLNDPLAPISEELLKSSTIVVPISPPLASSKTPAFRSAGLTPIPGSLSLGGHVQMLIEQNIISAEAWQSIPPEVRDNLANSNLEDLLAALLQREIITTYQADRIRAGNIHGLVIGNYRILKRLGAGGMGVVYKAEQIRLQRPVALKVLAYGFAGHYRLLQRFWSETRAVAQLQHPHIVTAIDAGEIEPTAEGEPSVPYFVMEYLEGEDLEDRVIRSGPLPVGDACRWISQIADALSEAHRLKLIHRDIKPSNIFLTARGSAKLLDFGLARQTERQGITEAGMLLGTVGYMAPEQAKDARKVDERADLYSLGCTLYWALAGQHPMGESAVGRTNRRPVPIKVYRKEVPDELAELVRKLMNENPEDRPKDALTVFKMLLSFIPSNEPTVVPEARIEKKEPEAPKRHRVLVIDDAPTVRMMCSQTVQRAGMECVEASDGGEALEYLQGEPFDLVLLDYQLPDMSGADILKKIREQKNHQNAKVVMMSGMRDSADLTFMRLLGADEFVSKPFTSAQLLTLVRANLQAKAVVDLTRNEAQGLIAENERLKKSLTYLNTELVRTRDFLMQTISELIGERNYISGSRALRLQRYCRTLATEASKEPVFKTEITPEMINLLETWVPLMDVGHLLLPDYLLLKAGELTADERELMQAHTTLGADLLERIGSRQPGQMPFFQMAITIARMHHEHWNGEGYPNRLSGRSIPLPARIASLADVYDALRSHRVYRTAFSHSNACEVICESAGKQFDPDLVPVFVRCQHIFEQIFRELPE